ncbi:MAG: hypothetical protein KAV82_14740 [Phycisphaerae bacterium]|nr:hypothetical protein [Phycisphaerae bacterium]
MMQRKARSKRTSRRVVVDPAHDTAEFGREFVADSFKPPSSEARAKWLKAKRKRGRPVEGKGAKVISVSIEEGLLERADALAKEMRISRARLIARGLRAVLASQGIKAP